MKQRSRRTRFATILVLALPVLSSVGCATTTKLSGFDLMAEAGAQYASAVDDLLTTSSRILVDTNSDKLLQTVAEFPGAVTARSLEQQDEPLRQNLREILLLREQVELLSDYFAALDALASTGAASSFGGEIQSTVGDLETLAGTLGAGQLASNPAAVGQLSGTAGTLVVRHIQVRGLEKELEARKQTIAEILNLHQALFSALKAQVGADIEFNRQRQYEKDVAEPLVRGTITDATSWKQRRLELLETPPIDQRLSAAASAAKKLESAWAKLLAGGLSAADVQAISAILSQVVDEIGALKQPPPSS